MYWIIISQMLYVFVSPGNQMFYTTDQISLQTYLPNNLPAHTLISYLL